ncbi:MAG: CDP-alcohol phosphatidyltransferase family protein [Deltaproteobacteria bacterium]|nr:CDP-alcohol phosphatidyltransferase family protein [Deltaproteobacteria bacterium]MBW2419107.1 CDP-alcohol phosphatidyltransferase family protein [Deltaproteobacteria bacterium]
MIKEHFGSRLDGVIHTLFPFLFKRSINPDLLTVTGALVSLLAAVAFAAGHYRLGGCVLLAGGFFDLVDGVVARHFGISTTFGGFLDSTLDRFVDVVVLLGIVIHLSSVGQLGHALLAALVLTSSVLTSYAKARAELHVPQLEGGIFERGERIGLLAAGAILNWMVPVLWLLAAGTTLTAIQRVVAAHREMTILDAAAVAGAGEEVS